MHGDWQEVFGGNFTVQDAKEFAEAYRKFMEKRGRSMNEWGAFREVNKRRRLEKQKNDKKNNQKMAKQKNNIT